MLLHGELEHRHEAERPPVPGIIGLGHQGPSVAGALLLDEEISLLLFELLVGIKAQDSLCPQVIDQVEARAAEKGIGQAVAHLQRVRPDLDGEVLQHARFDDYSIGRGGDVVAHPLANIVEV